MLVTKYSDQNMKYFNVFQDVFEKSNTLWKYLNTEIFLYGKLNYKYLNTYIYKWPLANSNI